MDSFVTIKVGNQWQRTGIRRSSDAPFFNEYFVFEYRTDLQSVMDKQISFKVIKPRTCCSGRRTLGGCSLDIATIWNQPDHIFYQKWAIITSESPKYIGPRGYLKVTLSVVTKDSQAKLPLANPNINDEIEGNLLLPDGLTVQRERATFIFKIYKADHLIKNKNVICGNIRKSAAGLPSSFIEITFAGVKASTSVKKHNLNPVWNEELTIAELFPPLCQRVKIQLKSKNTNLHAVKYLQLHSIANDQENGFLPTFGPTYVHFYKKDRFGEVYVGKVLMELRMQLQKEYLTKPKTFSKKSIVPINENTLWSSEPILLFCSIISVNAIDRRFSKKPIRFEISVGPTRQDDASTSKGANPLPNVTTDMVPSTIDKTYWFLDLKGQIPCLNYQNRFPELRRRFYNKNLIKKISTELTIGYDV